MMIKTIDVEIDRQLENIKNKKSIGDRNALPDGKSEFKMPGADRMYPETDLAYYALEELE